MNDPSLMQDITVAFCYAVIASALTIGITIIAAMVAIAVILT